MSKLVNGSIFSNLNNGIIHDFKFIVCIFYGNVYIAIRIDFKYFKITWFSNYSMTGIENVLFLLYKLIPFGSYILYTLLLTALFLFYMS